MKLNKKFLSCLTAVTVAMAPMAAFADVTPYDITGSGSVEYLDTEIYNVVLPTSNSINFTIDPYGVTAPNFDNSQSLGDIVSNAAGTVTSSATAVINKSSVGLDVKIELLFDDAKASNSAVKLATTKDEAKNGDKDLYLTVQHLSGATLGTVVTDKAVTLTGSAVSDGAFTLSTAALNINNWGSVTNGATTVVTATGTAALASADAIEFTLKDVAKAYFVSGKVATLSEGAVRYTPDNVYAFAITGYAKPTSTVWKDIDTAGGELELTMKFTIDKAEENPVKTAYHVKTDTTNSAYIGITATGGITDLSLLSDVKCNGVTISPYATIVNNCFAILKASWSTGDIVTFTYDGVNYSVTLT